MERWNDTDRGKSKNLEEKLSRCHLHIYNPHSILEHRVFFHLTILLAVWSRSRTFPVIFASSSTVLLHATFGLPRLPCRFQSKASHAISLGSLRSVWPSHPHFQCQISKSILIWLVTVHGSLFDIWTGQNMHKILRRHLLIKTCTCLVIVLLAFHILQLYKRNDFTLEWNRPSFFPMEYASEFHILSSALNAMHACFLYPGHYISMYHHFHQ
jgi:hypothetical protein